MSWYVLLRRLLFQADPEWIHHRTLDALYLSGRIGIARRIMAAVFEAGSCSQPVHVMGMDFPNPIGLAAGFDKDGRAARGLAQLGFGHLELGTVTLRAQRGNPRPRVFRLLQDEGLINRMGFPNAGAMALLRRLRELPRDHNVRIGVNIGKNSDTPLEEAAEDYVRLMKLFATQADYLAVNVSCPNLEGLSRLQGRDELEALLKRLRQERAQLPGGAQRIPLVVKLSPDLSLNELEDAVGVIQDQGLDGIIATNTTVQREGLVSSNRDETGGLSGWPLRALSTNTIAHISRFTQGKLPIIAAGGVFDAGDVRAKLDAGAALVQVYTGMIYRGPGIVRSILRELGAQWG